MQQTQQGSQHHLGPIPTQQAVAPSVHPQGPGAFQPAVGGKNTTSNASTTPIPEWTTNNAASHPLVPITTPQAVAPSAHTQAPAGAFQPTPPTSLPMPQSPYGRSPYVLDPSQRSSFASD
jgi:hypothetical protein